jgi:predicted anti-sigma-YlaC factor YlaD
MSRRGDEDQTGIIGLVKETAEGLGKLLGDHVRLARIELVADIKGYGRDVAMLVVAAVVVVIGYAFAWVAGGLALARLIGGPLAFALIAFVHLVAGAIAAVVAVRRARGTRPLQETANEVERSVRALKHPVLPPPTLNGPHNVGRRV